MYSGQIKCLIPILFNVSLTSFCFLLSKIQYRYLCRIFERKCSFDDVFSLFEVDQVNIKYVSRATQSHFVVNYVTNTNQIDKNRMQYQGLDNDRAKHVSNSVLCENKSNLHQQNAQWWCFLCPLRHFVLLKNTLFMVRVL